MKNIFIIACISFSISLSSFGQRMSETGFALGLNKTSSPGHDGRWEEVSPTFLRVGGTKYWYSNDHRLSLHKETGLNFQFANLDLSTGGLGAGNHYTGHIFSFFANAALQARWRISNSLAFGLGPEAEILIIGQNKLNNEYYTHFTQPPSGGNVHHEGLNRDYFNKPSYGIKLSLFESKIDAKTSIGLHFSYLWTKRESSNFYASNYARFSFVIGFKNQKKQKIPDLQIEQTK